MSNINLPPPSPDFEDSDYFVVGGDSHAVGQRIGEGAWPGGGAEERQGGVPETWPDQVNMSLLWKMLESHKEETRKHSEEVKASAEEQLASTWEMVVIQGVLLTVLVLVSVCWAFCCKKKCFGSGPLVDEVVALARKISASSGDLPPSYSKLDLHTLGLSVYDYLHPPPTYLEICQDNLQYLDLETGSHRRRSSGDSRRMSKASLANSDEADSRRVSVNDAGVGSLSRLSRLSVVSCSSCHSEMPVYVSVRSENPSNSSSRRTSKVSFCEDVNVSNGSIRRLSKNSLSSSASSRRSSSSSTSSSRRLSSSSDGLYSRPAFIELRHVPRKTSSPEFSTVDDELKLRLAKAEEVVTDIETLEEVIEEEEN